jgi:hypothetical protein
MSRFRRGVMTTPQRSGNSEDENSHPEGETRRFSEFRFPFSGFGLPVYSS